MKTITEAVQFYKEPLAFSTLFTGYDEDNDTEVVIKSIIKNKLLTDSQIYMAKQEFPLHCSLDHPNIVKAYNFEETPHEFVMSMEYLNKANYLKEKVDLFLQPIKSEIKLKSYMAEIMDGLAYLHSLGIVHCDIKLENILCHKNDDELEIPEIKLCDFGLAHIIDSNTKKIYFQDKCGTHSYIAPEIHKNTYLTEKVDIWSAGIVLYKLAVGYKPTQVSGYQYGSGPIPFRKFDWKDRSPDLINLLQKMLEIDPNKRISSVEILNHPWFEIQFKIRRTTK